MLEAPPELRVPGLRLVRRPLAVGSTVRVGIATGAGRGVASGSVAAVGLTQTIWPLTTPVAGLAALACAVAPGATGAPVVDERFQLAGFIIAGRDDAPESTMYPVAAWQDAVRSLGSVGAAARVD